MSGHAKVITALINVVVIASLVAGHYGWKGIWADVAFWAATILTICRALMAIAMPEKPKR